MREYFNFACLFFVIITVIFSCSNNNELDLYPKEKFVDTVKRGLIAHYTFDGAISDISGNEFPAITHGSPTYETNRFGEELKSMYLNGLTDYITAFIGKHDSISISAWIYPEFYYNVNAKLFEYGHKTFNVQQCDATTGPTTRRWQMKTTHNNEYVIETFYETLFFKQSLCCF